MFLSLMKICFFLTLTMFSIFMGLSSPSLMMISIVLITGLMGLFVYFSMSLSVYVIVVLLSVIGGLFILISFVVMALPTDFESSSVKSTKMVLFPIFLIPSTFSMSMVSSWEGPSLSSLSDKLILSSSVSSWLSLGMIFLLLLLVMLLKVINTLTLRSGGALFSPKKVSEKTSLSG